MAKAATKKPASKSSDVDDFDKLVNSPEYKKAWKESKNADPGQSFSNPPLKDGRYGLRITSVKVGVTAAKEGRASVPYLSVTGQLTQGEFKGQSVNLFFNLSPDRQEMAVKALKRLGYEFDEDSSMVDIKEIAADLNETKPLIQISVQNKTGEVVDKKTKKKVKQNFQNIYIDRMLSTDPPEEDEEVEEDEENEDDADDDAEAEEDDAEEDESEEDDAADADDEADEDEGDGDEGEDEESIEVGDTVKYKAPGTKKAEDYAVTKIKGTKATLKHLKTKTVILNVPIDELEIVYEE